MLTCLFLRLSAEIAHRTPLDMRQLRADLFVRAVGLCIEDDLVFSDGDLTGPGGVAPDC